VAWITERRDVLVGLFAFATLLAWVSACGRDGPARAQRARGEWLLALAALIMAQIGIWKDSVSLWRRAAEVEPASDIPIFYLGWALEETGRFDEAQAHFEWSLVHVPPALPALRAQFLFHIALVEQRAGHMAATERASRLEPRAECGAGARQ